MSHELIVKKRVKAGRIEVEVTIDNLPLRSFLRSIDENLRFANPGYRIYYDKQDRWIYYGNHGPMRINFNISKDDSACKMAHKISRTLQQINHWKQKCDKEDQLATSEVIMQFSLDNNGFRIRDSKGRFVKS